MQSVVVVCSYTAALFLFVKNRKLKFALYLIQLIFNKDLSVANMGGCIPAFNT